MTSLLLWMLAAQAAPPPAAVFGTTVVIPSGLKGDIYHLREGTQTLADLPRYQPLGSIYTTALNVPPQDFSLGFPGITERFEWFALDYTGKFWIETPGVYRFRLTSDDAAMLYIDGLLVIDNDGVHSPMARRGSVRLAGGMHTIRVPYFQGPRDTVALMLEVAGPGEAQARIFSTEEFKPPPNPEQWRHPGTPPEAFTEPDLSRDIPERLAAPRPKGKPGKFKRPRVR